MCGISGILSDSKENIGVVESMVSILDHRGPDSSAIFEDSSVVLGHNRLSIIDLSLKGKQPMSNDKGTIWITYNGEIYNYLELKNNLNNSIFNSNTDTEVIIKLYEKYGFECLKYLNGMFSFAIWDSNKKILFCARDRFGVKPFYYTLDQNQFTFSSEIKAILQSSKYRKNLNTNMLAKFLLHGSYTPEENKTFFRDIYELEPSHYAIIRIQNRKVTFVKKKYYCIKIRNSKPSVKLFDTLLRNSVDLRLRSDVPVGLLLSGGIDSSSLAYYMKNSEEAKETHYFTAVSSDKKTDESAYAMLVSEHLGINCTKVYPKFDTLINELDRVTYSLEQPVPGSSMVSHYNLMKQINKQKIKVVLHGQGADEILAGYDFHRYHLAEKIRKRNYISYIKDLVDAYSAKNVSYKSSSTALFLSSMKYYIKPDLLRQSVHNSEYIINSSDYKVHLSKKTEGNMLKNKMLDYINTSNLPYILNYEDKNSMAFSIESREPFLDPLLASYCLGLPNQFFFKGLESKHILKCAMRNRLPKKIIQRKKVGFSSPRDKWLNDSKDDIINLLAKPKLNDLNIIDDYRIEKLIHRYYTNPNSNLSILLWRVVSSELFAKNNYNSINE